MSDQAFIDRKINTLCDELYDLEQLLLANWPARLESRVRVSLKGFFEASTPYLYCSRVVVDDEPQIRFKFEPSWTTDEFLIPKCRSEMLECLGLNWFSQFMSKWPKVKKKLTKEVYKRRRDYMRALTRI